MLAEIDLRNTTQAEGHASSTLVQRTLDAYVAAEDRNVSTLVFPGPRMQLRTTIVAGSRVYSLKGVFVLDLEYLEENVVFVSHRTAPVHAYGHGSEEALWAFSEAFDLQ